MVVLDGDVHAAVGLVLKCALEDFLERAAEQEVEGCVLNDMSMYLERHVSYLQS